MGSNLALQLPDMAVFATAFNSAEATTLAWLHLVTIDLFQARWVYADGQRHNVPIGHSAVLCFMVGPLGLLSHLCTKAIVIWKRRRSSEQQNAFSA
ncbi:hypothetical protein Ndes2437A_g08182 [Nannochloris sp. 'desiccata']